MQSILLFILSLLLSLPVISQGNLDKLRDSIDNYMIANEYSKAIILRQKLLNEIPDTSKEYARTKVQIGLMYNNLDSFEMARKWYKDVMSDSKIYDNVEDFWAGEWEVRGNYKHASCYNMAVSYFSEKNYNQSLKYYKLALDSFPYYHFSGSDINKNKVKISKNIADLYSKKDQLDSAFMYLLPFFENPIVYSEWAESKAARIILEHGLKDEYLNQMKKGYESLIQKNEIALVFKTKKIRFESYNEDEVGKAQIEEIAKKYWNSLNNSKIEKELRK